jgi:hypothetical protein
VNPQPNPTQPATLEIVKSWLKSRLVSVMSVQNCVIAPGNTLVVHTWTGVIVNVYLIQEVPKLRNLKRVLQEATDLGIGSMFILDADLLPAPNTRFDPDEWLLALHTLTHERLYAYDIDDNGPKLVQVHFDQIGSTAAYVAKLGPDVTFDQLRILKITVKPKVMKGDWHIADFGLNAFWRDPYRTQRTEYRRPDNRDYNWRAWSQTTWEQSRTQEIPNTNGNGGGGNGSTPPPRPAPSPRHRLDQCFALLEIERDATRDEIKAAYRKLARAVHPDTSTLPKDQAEHKFRQLTEAYEYIKSIQNW